MGVLNLDWGTPYKVADGWQREWLIPFEICSQFFDYWKKNSFKLKIDGYGVIKKENKWYVIEKQPKKELFDAPQVENKIEKVKELVPKEVKHTEGLRPWQVSAVGKLVAAIDSWGCAIDGSDVGVGKTYNACGTIRELNAKMFIVCPIAVMESWRRVICNHFKIQDKLIGIINYESLRVGRTDNPYASYVKRRDTRRKEFVWKLPKNTVIIWDESQKLKGATTKNSETCLAALKQGYRMIFCSATNATNPLELRTVGMCLGLFSNNKQYYKWLYEHGVVKGRFGLEFKGNNDILKKLHKDIFIDRGVRLSRDTIPNFPESQIIAECYDMEEEVQKKINAVYSEMNKELEKLRKKIKKEKTSELTAILRARQEIELIKVPLFVEMIEEGIENGMSVAVFVNFTETLHALSERLNTQCIVNGEAKYKKTRQQSIDDFQDDKERVILINIAAGGAGLSLHDINGKHPRLAIISPSYSPVNMRQSTGRVWRDSSKTKSIQKIVFVANTVEEKVCENVNKKLTNLDLLNDGDLNYDKNSNS